MPVKPDPDTNGIFGEHPDDWNTCGPALLGLYHNLPADHPDVAPADDVDSGDDADTGGPIVDWDTVDWFDTDRRAFARLYASLEFGSGFWPVDTVLDGT